MMVRCLLLMSLALAACGGATPSPPVTPGADQSASPAVRSITVKDADNGRTVTIAKGGRITVVLESLYWNFDGSSNPNVLRAAGQPVKAAVGGCPPGVGCGSVTLSLDALSAGRADVTASRTSCGEAMLCAPDQRAFRITVVVTA